MQPHEDFAIATSEYANTLDLTRIPQKTYLSSELIASKIVLRETLEIKASQATVWASLGQLAKWPEWFGSLNVSAPLDFGPHVRVSSPLTRLFTPLHPFRHSDRAAQLCQLEPGKSARWTAQGREMAATQIWRLEAMPEAVELNEGVASLNFQPRTLVTLELVFSGMTEWYFNVMGVAPKMRVACDEILTQLRAISQ